MVSTYLPMRIRLGRVWGGTGYPLGVGTRPPRDLRFLLLLAQPATAEKDDSWRACSPGYPLGEPPCAIDHIAIVLARRVIEEIMRLILYLGKGGVGKTTTAAATAARAAELGHRTLVVSTDVA